MILTPQERALSGRIQTILELAYSMPLRGPARYGPLASTRVTDGLGIGRYRTDAIEVWANWRPGIREPYLSIQRDIGTNPEAWPDLAWACSTGLALWLTLACDDVENYNPRWGRQTSSMLQEPAWAARIRPVRVGSEADAAALARTWWRRHDPAALPAPPSHVGVTGHCGHGVLWVDCDRLRVVDPRTRERCRGIWILAADGNFSPKTGTPRRYNLLGTRFEAAATRAARSKAKVAFFGVDCLGSLTPFARVRLRSRRHG